ASMMRSTNRPTNISVKSTAYDINPPACGDSGSACRANVILEERSNSRLDIVRRTPWCATHESNVSTAPVELEPQKWILEADLFDITQYLGRVERIVQRAQ